MKQRVTSTGPFRIRRRSRNFRCMPSW